MCCDNRNENKTEGECDYCGGPIDADGASTDQCNYSDEECDVCMASPCNQAC